MTRALVLAALLVAGSARADVWQRAIDGAQTLEAYEGLLARGDELALSANAKSVSLPQMKRDIEAALEAYRAAAKLNPKAGEPLYRIGALLHSFYFNCDSFMSTPPQTCGDAGKDRRAKEIVEAWDAFETRAPLDPRVNQMLLERAILRTKLVASNPGDKALLEGALKDYQALVDRADGLLRKSSYLVLGNLAETHMMLGQLDESIDVYREAIKAGGGTSTVYGLAVALDRDERGAQAATLIRDQGFDAYKQFEHDVHVLGNVFFVPPGEEHYYFGLIEEAFGNYDAAIAHWRLYIQSGAHPQYQPRAKEHLDELLGKSGKKNLKWRPISRDPLRDL